MSEPRAGGFRGLTSEEARARLEVHGPNALPAARPDPWWARVARQLRSSIIYILLFALGFDLAVWIAEGTQEWPFESLAIATILVFNTAMGVWQEYRAEDALKRLQELAAPRVCVLRDGEISMIDATLLVPGDLVRVEAGDRIPADGLLTSEQALQVDESVLTGESVPVERGIGEPALSGTLAVRGLAWIEVGRTGADSAMGRIATMLAGVTMERTPLERRMDHFGHRIARWIALLAVVLTVGGVLIDGIEQLDEALLFAVAVAVAAVPEGLPAVLTLTLALGTERMSVRKAVVRRLSAVEALGSVTVIATDKTGTLTENSMSVQNLDSPDPGRALRAMVLAADAEPLGEVGDALELGLYAYADAHGVDPVALRAEHPRQSVRPFDSAWRFMRVSVVEDGRVVSYLKGAAEVLLERSDLDEATRKDWEARNEAAAAQGYRVLGLAWSPDDREEHVVWLGVAWLWDPPRPEVPGAIASAHAAGIRVLMITGDHPSTALTIAERIGIPSSRALTGDDLDRLGPDELREAVAEVSVFARVSPEHKLALVSALKASGEIVAMTGDGVNDAPALKRSDVGVAMGQRGSDVSREVADLVLLDDNFATIAAAVEEGRGIYDNIQKFLRFLFSTNVALVILIVAGVVGAAIVGLRDNLGNLLVPLTAAQLLWINVIADGPPALALGLDRNPDVMSRRPRAPSAPLLTRGCTRFILWSGALKASLGIALFFWLPELGYSGDQARTAVFLYESLAQLAFVYPARVISSRPVPNRVLNTIVLVSVLVQVATVALPGLRTLLSLELLDLGAFGVIAAALGLSVVGAFLLARATTEPD
ncbi:cation-translocating P-type ATPase [Actinotalea sp.]|uniref:cation-translocating P-type ATPase n=1 Tax=Actinotalea sp. TaxID=1872145 RepID=UPI003569BCDA